MCSEIKVERYELFYLISSFAVQNFNETVAFTKGATDD